MKKIFVSVGDLNGIGFEIALAAHEFAREAADISYCVSERNAAAAARLLGAKIPADFRCVGECAGDENGEAIVAIEAGKVAADAGMASFQSFERAVFAAQNGEADAIVTLPINKAAWAATGLGYKGHTDYLRERFGEAIMAIGCRERFAAFFTEHIPLREVAGRVKFEPLLDFLLRLAANMAIKPIGVLGLNPHSGDNGAIGDEEREIERAIVAANAALGSDVFEGAIVPDAAWTRGNLQRYRAIAAMYHDQALPALKALFFEESINVTLGLPFARASVDHGTAFDIAYRGKNPSIASYKNAILTAANGVFVI